MRRKVINAACWLGLFLATCVFALGVATTRGSAQTIKTGTGIICDRPDQVETFVSLWQKGDNPAIAAKQVNEQAGSETACAYIMVAFYEGQDVKTLEGKNAGRIVAITVIGTWVTDRWIVGPPFPQFTFYDAPGEAT